MDTGTLLLKPPSLVYNRCPPGPSPTVCAPMAPHPYSTLETVLYVLVGCNTTVWALFLATWACAWVHRGTAVLVRVQYRAVRHGGRQVLRACTWVCGWCCCCGWCGCGCCRGNRRRRRRLTRHPRRGAASSWGVPMAGLFCCCCCCCCCLWYFWHFWYRPRSAAP